MRYRAVVGANFRVVALLLLVVAVEDVFRLRVPRDVALRHDRPEILIFFKN